MPRSLANGDYSLVMAVESSSRPDSWYRVLADRHTGTLSCDCPPWTFKQDRQATETERSCHHTRIAQHISQVALPSFETHLMPFSTDFDQSTIITATRQQWPGLLGEWSIDCHVAEINHKPYLVHTSQLTYGKWGNGNGHDSLCQTTPTNATAPANESGHVVWLCNSIRGSPHRWLSPGRATT